MLKKRVVTAFLLIPLVIIVVWFNEPIPWLAVFAAIWGIVAAREFYQAVIQSNQRVEPLTYFGLIWILFLILSPLFDYRYLNILLLGSAVILPALWFFLWRRRGGAFTAWAYTVSGIIFIGWFLSHFVALRELDLGREWVFFAMFVTFASDSTAYFIGKAIGKHYLAPSISPKKTWEGTIGGILGAIVIGLLLVILLKLPISYLHSIPLSIAVSIIGQLGDLFESLFKRRVRIKDSGKTIPGHGGFLDRMDSVVFSGVFIYYYVVVSENIGLLL
jgi:phosphatidate cytidylyltransferase